MLKRLPGGTSATSRGRSDDVIRAVALCALLTSLGAGMPVIAMPLAAAHKGEAGLWLGLSFSGYFLAKLCVAPLAGMLAGSRGPRPLLLASTLAGALVATGGALAGDWILPAVQLITGMAGGVVRPVGLAVAGARADAEKDGRAFALLGGIFHASLLASQIAGAFIFSLGGTRAVAAASALCLWGAFLSIRALMPRQASCVAHRVAAGTNPRSVPSATLLSLLAAVFGRTAGTAALVTFLPLLVMQRPGAGPLTAAWLLAAPNLALLAALPVTGRLPGTLDRRLPTLAGMALCAACLWGVADAHAPVVLILLCLGLGLGSAISLPASMSLASSLGGNQGAVMGVVQGAASLGLVAGPALGGLVMSLGGPEAGLQAVFRAAGAFGALCLLPLAAGLPRRPDKTIQAAGRPKRPALVNT